MAANFPIERGVPIPVRAKGILCFGLRVGITETIRKMQVGDSFHFDLAEEAAKIRSVASHLDISIRMELNKEIGNRCWRVG